MIKTLTRRGLLQSSAVAAALAFGLTACGGGGNAAPQQTVNSDAVEQALQKGGKLTVWAWDQSLKKVADDFVDARIPRHVPDEAVHIDGLLTYGSAANERSANAAINVPVGGHFVVHVDGNYSNSDDLEIGGFVLTPRRCAPRPRPAPIPRSARSRRYVGACPTARAAPGTRIPSSPQGSVSMIARMSPASL